MTDEERSKLLDKLEQLRFFNQRAGRELWSDKSQELQDEDIKNADAILEMAISALKENTEESEDQSVEWYCTDCPYFQYTGDPTDYWYGARCNKDKHEVNPSMMAIQELNNNCPLNRR